MLPVLFSPRATVLDCAADRTVVAVFRRRSDRLRLEFSAARIHPSAAGNHDSWIENTRAALQALRKAVVSPDPVTLVVPAHLVFTKQVKVPRVASAKLAKVVAFEAEQNLPYALADVYWDSTIAGEDDSGVDILLAATRREPIDHLCAAVREAGFEPRTVLPASLATLAAFRLAQSTLVEPVVVLNLGAVSTTLLLVDRDRFVLRTIRAGVGRDVVQGAGQAESGATGAGPSTLCAAGTPPLESLGQRLAQETMRSILGFCRPGGTRIPGTLFFAGVESQAAALGKILSTRLKLQVKPLDLTRSFEIAAGVAVDGATTITGLAGAAAIRLQAGHPAVNLIPFRWQQRESFRRRRPWLVAAALFTLAAPGPAWLHFHRVVAEAEKKAAAIERELVPLQARERRIESARRRLDGLKQRVALMNAIDGRRPAWVGLFSDLQERLDQVGDVWLEKLQLVPVAPGAPRKLAVSGRMLDRANPLAKVSPATFDRVKALLDSIAGSPFVAAVEGERFDNQQPGILGFDFVVWTRPQRPL